MTIEELLAATGLTANDLIPIYDAEAAQNVEPTQKVTAAQLAAAVKVLASLVNTTEMNAAIQQSTATAFTQKDESASNIVSTGTEVVVTTKTITSPKSSSNVLIVYSAPIKTSANTSTLYIKVDDTIVGNPMSTNQTAFITVTGFALASMAAGSHTVKLCMKSQNSSTTGTIPSYNSVAFAVVVL